MKIFATLLLTCAAALGAVTPAVQSDQTTKHVVQPPGFWPAQPGDSAFVNAVRASQTNGPGSGGGAVSSVNGQVGVVSLTTSDLPEGTNLYWTTIRSNALWQLAVSMFYPLASNPSNFVTAAALSSVTNNAGSTVNLNAATSDTAKSADLATNLISGAVLTNASFDITGGKTVSFRVSAVRSDDVIFKQRAATLVVSNSGPVGFISGIDGRDGETDTETWRINSADGTALFNGGISASTFTGNGSAITGLTNGLVGAATLTAATNALDVAIRSSIPSTNGFVTSTITNGLVGAATLTAATNALDIAIRSVIPSTNGFVTTSVTNGLLGAGSVGNAAYSNADAFITPVQLSSSNFVTTTVTNGLATIARLTSATNDLNSALVTTIQNATNGGGTANLSILGNAATATSAINSTNFWGQLSVTNYGNGTSASSATFLRGDGTWVTPSGGASLGIVTNGGSGLNNNFTNPFAISLTNQDRIVVIDATGNLVNWLSISNVNAAFTFGNASGLADINAKVVTGSSVNSSGGMVAAANITSSAGQFVGNGAGVTNQIRTIGITIDGGGSAITTGVKGYIEVPFGCGIQRATLLADQTGSAGIAIWKCTYNQFDAGASHPVAGDAITASSPPALNNANKSQDTTLAGWTNAITAGDILAFNVLSNATCTRLTLTLKAVTQ